jgi:hypothetical protein
MQRMRPSIQHKENLIEHGNSVHTLPPIRFSAAVEESTTSSNPVKDDYCTEATSVKDFACSDRDQVFRSESSLEHHGLWNHLPSAIRCEKCNQAFGTKTDLELHGQKKPGQANLECAFNCWICDMEFDSFDGLKYRESIEYPRSWCNICRQLCDKKALKVHIRRDHMRYIHKCTKCDRSSNTEFSLTEHHQTAHPPPKFECQKCDQIFANVNDLESHESIEHPKFQCEQCDHIFDNQDSFQKHQGLAHPAMLECEICQKVFFNEESRKSHETWHKLRCKK